MLEKTGVEALVLDPIQFFVELAAMKLRIPYVTVATALYIDFSGYTPAGIFGWPHETTPDALARNLQAVTEAVRFCYNGGIKSYAKKLGFKTDLDHPSWFFPSWLILLSFRKSSISNTLYYLHSFITPVRFMMARAGTRWIFLGTD